MPLALAPAASRTAACREGRGVTATRNGLRRTSSASMYSIPGNAATNFTRSCLLVHVLRADPVTAELVDVDPLDLERRAVRGVAGDPPPAGAERARHRRWLEPDLGAPLVCKGLGEALQHRVAAPYELAAERRVDGIRHQVAAQGVEVAVAPRAREMVEARGGHL